MIFEGARFCAFCGAEASRSRNTDTRLPCPKCKKADLGHVLLGATEVHECARCHGLWVGAETFDRICTDREKQSAVLGTASEMFRSGQREMELKIKYVRCPICTTLMHRVNFAKCSGIILDVCKGHGTWFDRDELQHIVEFIRTGGLDLSRAKEKAELEAARRRLESSRTKVSMERPRDPNDHWQFGEPDLVVIAGSLIRRLFD